MGGFLRPSTQLQPGDLRQVISAWDVAFNWIVDEPHERNAALPLSVLLALVSLALLWGWSREAAILLLGWSGVLWDRRDPQCD